MSEETTTHEPRIIVLSARVLGQLMHTYVGLKEYKSTLKGQTAPTEMFVLYDKRELKIPQGDALPDVEAGNWAEKAPPVDPRFQVRHFNR